MSKKQENPDTRKIKKLEKLIKNLEKTVEKSKDELKRTETELEKEKAKTKSLQKKLGTQSKMDQVDMAIFLKRDVKYLLLKKEMRSDGTEKHKELLKLTTYGRAEEKYILSLRNQVQPTKDEKVSMKKIMKNYKKPGRSDKEFQKQGGYQNIDLFKLGAGYLPGDRRKFKEVADGMREEIKNTKIGKCFMQMKATFDLPCVID